MRPLTPMQRAYQAGRKFFAAGMNEQQCPYRLSSKLALAWLDGWQDAQRERAVAPASVPVTPPGTAALPIVAGGQGHTNDDVKDAALNIVDAAFMAIVAIALALLLSGCATNLPKWGGA